VFDTQGKSIVANPALSLLLEKPPASLLDTPMQDILQEGNITPQDRGTILAMLHDPQKNMPSVRFHWGKRTLLVNAAPVITGLGDTIGTVAVFRDFTREAEVEQMKNTFVAMVSHELRTPLNAILGYAEMMREAVYGVLNVRQSGVVERIESSSKRLLNMVSDLLDQAQMDAGRMKIHISEFQFADLVGALHAYTDKSVADKGLYLNVEVDPNLPPVLRGDAQRLGQVLLNLVGNAVKFTERGGVTVRLRRLDDNRWGFEVSDTGPGIAPEAQQYVFESFRQVDNVRTREHGGIGLGLAIVKNLVQLMGGDISLSSFVGEGSTFNVTLPLDPSKEVK
jgi:signal transduction histidine kinase